MTDFSANRVHVERASRPDPAVAALLADPRSPPEKRLDACRHLMEMGYLRQATRHLTPLAALPSTAEVAATLLATCSRLEAFAIEPEDMAKADDEGPTAEDWWPVANGSSLTVVVFAGRARKVGISIYFMRRLFSRLGCNLIYLFDHRDTFYLQGVPSLGENLDSTLHALRYVIEEMGGRQLVCIGQSTGGYGAIHYGVALAADAVLAFSPLLLPPLSARVRNDLSQRIGRPLSLEDVDLRLIRLSNAAPPRLHIVCGALNAIDMRAAAHLGDLPGVSVAPIPGLADHGSLQASVVAGTFTDIVDSFMAEVRALLPAAR